MFYEGLGKLKGHEFCTRTALTEITLSLIDTASYSEPYVHPSTSRVMKAEKALTTLETGRRLRHLLLDLYRSVVHPACARGPTPPDPQRAERAVGTCACHVLVGSLSITNQQKVGQQWLSLWLERFKKVFESSLITPQPLPGAFSQD